MPAARRALAWSAIAVPALLLVLAAIGAFSAPSFGGLPEEPMATLVLLPFTRLWRDGAATLAIGFVLVGGLLCPRPDPRLLRAASIAAVSWLLAMAAFVVLTVSELLAFPLDHAVQPVVLASFVSQTTLGQLLVVQAACAAFTALLAWAIVNRITGGIVLVVALAGACATALTGHSGLHSGHVSASVSLALHVGAAALWAGGLIATVLVARRDPAVLARFSAVALACVMVVGESGLLNASLRLDGPAALVTTTYGAIVLAKAAALAWLIRLGWLQRTRVIQAAVDAPVRAQLLARYAGTELAVMGAAFALAVALSRTAAPEGVLPAAAFTQGAAASLAVGGGALIALLNRRSRWAARVQAFPEAWGIALAFTVVLVTGGTWLPAAIGATWAALVGSALLLATGSALCLAAWSPRAWPAIALASGGWIAAAAWHANAADPARWLGVAAAVGGMAAIGVLARRSRTDRMVDPGPALDHAHERTMSSR